MRLTRKPRLRAAAVAVLAGTLFGIAPRTAGAAPEQQDPCRPVPVVEVGDAVETNVQGRHQGSEDPKRLQRVHQLAPAVERHAAMRTLIEEGLHSTRRIPGQTTATVGGVAEGVSAPDNALCRA